MRISKRILALAALILVHCGEAQITLAELASFDVRTRAVTELEIAGGAPAGTVFEFYTTTQTDILSLAFWELSPNFYQHELGSDSAPTPLQEHFPAISADSWFSFPGSTNQLGNGFRLQELGGRETLWGDLADIGALSDFQFGSLTVPLGQTASFSGRMSLVNETDTGWNRYPLDFSVNANGEFDFQVSDMIVNRPPPEPVPPPVVEPEPTPVVIVGELLPPEPPIVEIIPPRESPPIPDLEVPIDLIFPESPPVVEIPIVTFVELPEITSVPRFNLDQAILDSLREHVLERAETIDLQVTGASAIDVSTTDHFITNNIQFFAFDGPSADVDFVRGADLAYFATHATTFALESAVPEPNAVALATISLLCLLGISPKRRRMS